MKKYTVWVVLLALLCFGAGLAAKDQPEKKLSKEANDLMKNFFEAHKAKKIPEAMEILKKVIVLEPEFASAYFNLGVLEYQTGDVENAIANVMNALKYKPDYEQAKRALHAFLYEAGHKANLDKNYEKSNDYFLKFLSTTTPEGEYKTAVTDAYFKVGYNYFSLKKYQESTEYFKKCLAMPGLETDKPEFYDNCIYFLGMNAHAMAQYQESRDYFLKYIELYKGKEAQSQFIGMANYLVGVNMFRLLEKQVEAKAPADQIAAAAKEIIPILIKAMDMQVQMEDAYIILGNAYIHAKDFEMAKKTYGTVIDRYPQSPNVDAYKKLVTDLEAQIKARDEANKPAPAPKGKKKTGK